MGKYIIFVLCSLGVVIPINCKELTYPLGRFNPAHGRGDHTRQSSYYLESVQPSSLAVDGDFTNNWSSCVQTKAELTNWWSVDLGDFYQVYSVTITSSTIEEPKLKWFAIYGYDVQPSDPNGQSGSKMCYRQNGQQGTSTTVKYECNNAPIIARHIVIYHEITNNVPLELRLCEVQVEADVKCGPYIPPDTPRGELTYEFPPLPGGMRRTDEDLDKLRSGPPQGSRAVYDCSKGYTLKQIGTCVDRQRTSHGVRQGVWQPIPQCEICEIGTYGMDCTSTCGNCRHNIRCDVVDGTCGVGCDAGWQGDKCLDKCASGTYGLRCSFYCGNCLDRATCHHIEGHCEACEPGYIGQMCKEKVDCGDPGQISNGQVNAAAGYEYMRQVEYSCSSDFNLHGTATRTCQANATWSGSEPECLRINCGFPPTPTPPASKFTVSFRDTILGSLAYYNCVTGATADVVPVVRECLPDGTWSGEHIDCRVVDCGTPPGPISPAPDKSVSFQQTTFMEAAEYFCGTGYTSNDPLTRNCESTGQWSDQTPKCTIVTCPFTATPQFGRVEYSSTNRELGTKVTYSCNAGYELMGGNERQCEADGMWSDNMPMCDEIDECEANPCGDNGRCRDEINSYQCSCFSGFTGDNCMTPVVDCTANPCKHASTCTDGGSNGYSCQCLPGYSGANCDLAMACEDIEAAPIDMMDMNREISLFSASIDSLVLYSSKLLGSNVTYTCGKGWTTEDSLTRYCVPDNSEGVRWNGTAPNCQPVNCGRAPQVENANMQSNVNYTYYQVAVYSCLMGYSTDDPTHLRCGENGQFQPATPPSCDPVDCGVPAPPINPGTDGGVEYTGTTYGNTALYDCGVGHSAFGFTTRSCLFTGRWSNSEPYCIPVTCGEPDLSSAGVVMKSITGVDYGDTAVYSCRNGYTTDDPLDISCLVTGDWSYGIPNCSRVDCGPLLSVPNARIDYSNGTLYGSKAEYVCRDGYMLTDGSATRHCESTGLWEEGQHPSCQDLDYCVPGVCNYRGSCAEDIYGFTCVCSDGFAGEFCEINVGCNSSPCQNGGRCYVTDDLFVCQCDQGFTGDLCQYSVDGPCGSSPCRNGGLCIVLSRSTYACNCSSQYEGTNCQNAVQDDVADDGDTNAQVDGQEYSGNTDENTSSGLPWWWMLIIVFLIADVVGLVILVVVLAARRRRSIVKEEVTVVQNVSAPNETVEPKKTAATLENEQNRRTSAGTVQTKSSSKTGDSHKTSETATSRKSGTTQGSGRTGDTTLQTGETTLQTGETTLQTGDSTLQTGSSQGSEQSGESSVISELGTNI